MNCPGCDRELRSDARFCDQCGHKLAAPGPAPIPSDSVGELRHATLLFADLQGFTALSESHDPDQVHDVMQRLFGITDRHIVDNGGRIEKHMGDAVMATFGVPVAREDDAVRAIRAALGFQAEVAGLADELEAEGFPPLALRVGISTGRVMVGALKSETGSESSIIGDVVNVASRLEKAAPAGGVLVAHDTWAHVRRHFEAEPQPPITVRGKTVPLKTYLVRRESRAPLIPHRRVLGRETEMIGREEELGALHRAFGRLAGDGPGELVVVIGAPGIGKSRLIDEWLEGLRGEAVAILRAQGRRESSDSPYGILAGAIAGAAELSDSDGTSARARLGRWVESWTGLGPAEVEETTHFLGELVSLSFADSPHLSGIRADPRAVRLGMGRALARVLAPRESPAPVLVVVEDTQWADAASLALLLEAREETGAAPVLVVSAGRPELLERHPRWVDQAIRQVRLEPLAAEPARRLVRHLFGTRQVSDEIIDELATRASGVPYFAEEIVRNLAEAGALPDGVERGDVERERVAAVPTTVEGTLQARLDRLGSTEREVVRAGAVLGRVFWRQPLPGLAELSEAEVDAALESLVRQEVLRGPGPPSIPEGGVEYGFVHGLLRDVAYRAIVSRRRQKLHGQCADWIERVMPDGAHALVGHHREMTGDAAAAARAYQAGAEAAAERYANEEAEALCRHCIRLMKEPSQVTVLARYRLAHLLRARGRVPEAEEEFRAAAQQAEQAGLPALQGTALGAVASLLGQAGRTEEAFACHERAVALVRGCDDDQARVVVFGGLANLYSDHHRFAEALPLYEEILSIARRTGDRRRLGTVLTNLGCMLRDSGRLEESRQKLDQALEVAREVGNRRGTAVVLASLGDLALRVGDFDEADTRYAEALTITREVGNRPIEGVLIGLQGAVHAGRGDHEEAARHFDEALAIVREVRDRLSEADILARKASLLHCSGEAEPAAGLYQDAIAIAVATGSPRGLIEWRSRCAMTLQELGRVDEARQLSSQALAAGSDDVDPCLVATAHTQRGRFLLLADHDLEGAARMADLARDFAGRPGGGRARGELRCLEGHLTLARGRSAADVLTEVRELVESQPTVELKRAQDRLELAQAAFDAPRPLVAGHDRDALTPAQRERLDRVLTER